MPINLSTGGGRPIALAFAPPSANHSEDLLWVLLNGDQLLRAYAFNGDRDSLSQQQDIDLSSELGSDQGGDIIVAPGTDHVLLTDRAGGRILRVDPADGSISVLVSCLQDPVGLAWQGGDLLVVDAQLGAVIRISADPANPGTCWRRGKTGNRS